MGGSLLLISGPPFVTRCVFLCTLQCMNHNCICVSFLSPSSCLSLFISFSLSLLLCTSRFVSLSHREREPKREGAGAVCSFFCVVGRCGEMCRQPAFSRRQFPRFVCARALVRVVAHGSHDPLPSWYLCIPLPVTNTHPPLGSFSLLQHLPTLSLCVCVRACQGCCTPWAILVDSSPVSLCTHTALNPRPSSLAFAALFFSQSCACTRSLFPIAHDA